MPGPSQPNIYALLIAINDYPIPSHRLRGCVNDADALANYLEKTYGERLKLLKRYDKDATRKGIIEGFDHFQAARDGDICLLYYSGHGSQASAPPELLHLEPDGTVETIVCWDSRISGGRDLLDKELGYLIWKAQRQKKVHFTALFDCCHSGTNTRGDLYTRARMAERSVETHVLKDLIGQEEYERTSTGSAQAGRVTPPRAAHVHLAAARANETAKEKQINSIPRGVFTYHLLQLLERDSSLTYQELVESLRPRIANEVSQQTPQMEGSDQAKNTPFLGTSGLPPQSAYTLTYASEARQWLLSAGQLHGLPADRADQIELQLIDGPADTQLKVKSVAATQTQVAVSPQLPTDRSYRVVVRALPVDKVKVALALDGQVEGLEILKSVLDEKGQLYFTITTEPTAADYILAARHSSFQLLKPGDDRPVFRRVEEYSEENARRFLQLSDRVAFWHHVQRIYHPTSRLTDQDFAIDWYRLDEAGAWDQSPEQSNSAPATRLNWKVPQEFAYGRDQRQPADKQDLAPAFRLRVRNTGRRPLFVSAVTLSATFGISNALLSQQELAPGEDIWMEDRPSGTTDIYQSIPVFIDPQLLALDVNEVTEYIKVFISTEEVDTNRFNQQPLDMERPQRTAAVTRGQGRQGLTAPSGPDWTVADLTMRILRPATAVKVRSEEPAKLATDVDLLLPAGVTATARLQTEATLSRDLGESVPTPSGWLPYDLGQAPLGSPALNVLELQDMQGAEQVNAEQPIRLKLPARRALNDEVVIPIGLDPDTGLYYPLGAMDENGEIRIDQVPEPTARGERSLGGSIKIFFLKTIDKHLGLGYDYPRLARATLADAAADNGTPGLSVSYDTDPAALREAVAGANTIVLYTHGIIGDTTEMPKIMRLVRDAAGNELEKQYDLILTFDYENLETPIEETAGKLKEKLTAIGLGPGHGKTLHLVAHSMGGLVSRWFVEKEGGNEIVTHLFMVGTPNAGSPYGSVYEMASTLTSVALNKAAFLTPYMVPINLLGRVIDRMVQTLKQMKPDSDFYQALNDGTDPGIPYTIVAGNTQLIPTELTERYKSLLQKVVQRFRQRGHYDALTLLLFRLPNDIAVSVDSMGGIPQGDKRKNPVRVIPAASDHISYFAEPGGLEALAKALF